MSDPYFKGKVAIVTASSTGIGLAIVQRLAKEGVKVIVSSRNKQHVEEAVQNIIKNGGDAHGVVCHVGNKADRMKLINQTITRYGGIDFLIPNAAVSTHVGNFMEATDTQIQKMWEINYRSVFSLIQQALPYLRKSKSGNVVIISSQAGLMLQPTLGHYAITKTALIALTKVLAKQLLYQNIRVNCIAPGIIKTKFSKLLWEGKQKQTAESNQVGRLGQVQDISNAAKFLLSNQSSYMTGETLYVAGRPSPRL